MTRARRPARGAILAAAAALLGAVLAQAASEGSAGRADRVDPLLYLPSGRYLKAVALGFDGLLADVVYLWSIQYYGDYRVQDRYLYLERIYDQVITELDPRYLDPYLVGAMIMNMEARQPEKALALLDKGIRNNPETWLLAFEAGFLCYNDLKDYGRAAAYFEAALRAPDVHPLVRRLYAAMREKSGDRRASLREWLAIHDTAADEYVRTVAWNHIHDLKVAIDLEDLETAVTRYRAARGRAPLRLADLVEAGMLASVPRDPEDRDYRYSGLDGSVRYAGSLVLAR